MTEHRNVPATAFGARLAELHNAATPGRWKTYEGNAKNVSIDRDPWPMGTNHHVVLSTPLRGGVTAGIQEAADAELIVYLRNHAAAILALMEALKLQNKASGLVPQVLAALEALND